MADANEAPWVRGTQYQLGVYHGIPAVQISKQGSDVVTIIRYGELGYEQAKRTAKRRGHP